MSILLLPDNVVHRIIYFLSEPEFVAKETDLSSTNSQPAYTALSTYPRDVFNLIRSCRRFREVYSRQRNGGEEFLQAFKTEFEKVFRRSRRVDESSVMPGRMSIVIGVLDQSEGKNSYKTLPSGSPHLQGFQEIVLNKGDPSMLGDIRRPGHDFPMSTQLTDVQKDLLRDLGRNWISMFKSGDLSLGDIEGREQQVIDIMENLPSFIVGVLSCHMWNETGRFTMLCRTRLNDFMLLHGIDGLWQEQQCYPFVIFGATKLSIAESIYSALVNSDYGSIRDTGGHPLWTGFGLDT
ncbi:hypothetical protein AOL_s00004g316 [Orbilia oligospora ATCC 24927]|uniref:Uncharacterized protein n=2 Tax=Orbilia oligospora TaxID=2813651 RepID=G1WYF6_ARTOA|nr:hypothetical protein AOL_s00004g316 [Orbilia oligospora ATCC 24927]EGX54283.1 hypothetical protein AOL_s00004g316 [Orbilia oligospora ATCC 24927]